ncbi:MAG TPA: TA system VapC family ribonuclease toxin [Stellaceae bacterium]|nr:TA system VapC family ribonuclease toxin [Stellaceae bacterium]
MILVDANLLIYAFDDASSHHSMTRPWLDGQLSGASPVGLPWESLAAFLRIVTNPRFYSGAVSTARAWQQVQEWLANDAAWIPLPTERHALILGKLLSAAGVRANLVPDAHLAALAISHGLILCSADAGFARFPGLRWTNPLSVECR